MLPRAKPLRLGDLELQVLEFLWQHAEANAKTVHAGLQASRQNTLNTIQSTLDRLYRKDLLERSKVAHSYVYRCRWSRTELLTQRLGDLAAELSGGEPNALLAAFVEFSSGLDESGLGELESMIAAYRQQAGKQP